MNNSVSVFKTPAPVSYRIFYSLIGLLAALSALNVYLPQGFAPGELPGELPASEPAIALASAVIVLILYGGLGYIGMRLADSLEFAPVWNREISFRNRLLRPGIWGVGLGMSFILVDLWLGSLHQLGPLPHPPFPTSLVASISAAIGEEVIYRLFFITLLLWIVQKFSPLDQPGPGIFWTAALLSGVVFAAGHLPSVMMLFGIREITALPTLLIVEILALNTALSLVAAYYLREVGLLGPIMIHLSADLVWHVIWGAL